MRDSWSSAFFLRNKYTNLPLKGNEIPVRISQHTGNSRYYRVSKRYVSNKISSAGFAATATQYGRRWISGT